MSEGHKNLHLSFSVYLSLYLSLSLADGSYIAPVEEKLNYMTSEDCTRYSGVLPCSNNGKCVIQDKCLCNGGYTSRTDFMFDYSYDCDINLVAIQALSIILLVLSVFMLLLGCYTLYLGRHKASLREPKTLIELNFTFAALGLILYAIPKMLYPELAIVGDGSNGWSILISFGFSLMHTCMFNGWVFFLKHIASFLRKSSRVLSRESQDILKNNREKIERFGSYLAILDFSFFIFPVIATQVPEHGEKVLIAYVIYDMFVLCSLSLLLAHVLLRSFVIELGKFIALGNADKNVEIMFSRLRLIRLTSYFFFLFIGPSHLLFIAWPYLRRKHVYYMILIFINSVIPSFGVLVMLMPSANSNVGSHKVVVENESSSFGSTKEAYIVSTKESADLEINSEEPI